MGKSESLLAGLQARLGRVCFRLIPNPNIWTLTSLVPASLGFLCLYFGDILVALLLFALSGLIDAIDGAVARLTGISSLGAFLDGMVDRYVEFLLYLGLLFWFENQGVVFLLPNSFWISLLIFGAMMPSFITAYADHRKLITGQEKLKKIGGILGRPRRLVLIYSGMLLGIFWPDAVLYSVIITGFLANFTAFQRIYLAIKLA